MLNHIYDIFSDDGKAIVSKYNSLGDGRYYDVESSTSFAFDHPLQTASDVRSHALESAHSDLM
jgi:capping protein alpha